MLRATLAFWLFFPWLLAVPCSGAGQKFRLPSARELTPFFQPVGLGQFALAPDGQHLAYTHRQAHWLNLIILDLARPGERVVVPIGEDPLVAGERLQVEVTFMEWADADRLVLASAVPSTDRGQLERDVSLRLFGPDGQVAAILIDRDELYTVVSPLSRAADAPAPPKFKPTDLSVPIEPESMEWPIVPIYLRVIGLDPEGGSVHVELDDIAHRQLRVVRIDLTTREHRVIYRENRARGSVPERLLYDQQGRPRLRQSAGFRRMSSPGSMADGARRWVVMPQHLRYRPAELEAEWREWEQVGAEPAAPYVLSAENYFGERAFPLGFDRDPQLLYVASNVGRNAYAIYRVDLATGHAVLVHEDPAIDLAGANQSLNGTTGTASAASSALSLRGSHTAPPLLVDRTQGVVGLRIRGPIGTHWLDPEFAARQAELDGWFRGRRVDVIGWDDRHERFVVWVSGPNDPGRIFLYHPGRPDQLTEILRGAPWWPAEDLPGAETFTFDAPQGVRLTGTLLLPRRSRLAPPPLLVVCRDFPTWSAPASPFDARVQALTCLGFAVVQVNHRGTAGWGTTHRDAIRADPDRAPLEDIRAAVNWLGQSRKINPRRVGLVGLDFGGHLALRALERYPREFRCAITFDAPIDVADWIDADLVFDSPVVLQQRAARRAYFSPAPETLAWPSAASIRRPVLMLQNESRSDLRADAGRAFVRALQKQDVEAEYRALNTRLAREDPVAQAKVFAQIGAFLNAHVFDYSVELGDLKELP